MKKYFAKFLMVDGEINEGDHYKCSDSNKILRSAMTGDFLDHTLWSVSLQKMKLFLLSREVEIGDEVHSKLYWNKGVIEGFKEDSKKTTFYFVGKTNTLKDWHVTNGWGKKIGEISSGAIWVKDGDEFDNNDIEMVYNAKKECLCETVNWWTDTNSCDHEIEDHYNKARMCGRYINVVCKVKIKCPTCNNFH